ncbi:MAG: carboxypeptidase-like regulatory domain-containing protein [Prevotella sp.]|nr:carboxypeptidase-like regulatory domain-containing protein [Prevotella sp.]
MKQKYILISILTFVCLLQTKAQTFTLQGRVTDEQMNPVELATVSVLKQGKVTITSMKGEFSMQLQSADSVIVSFSMVGYKTKTRLLRNPRGKQTLQVILFEDENLLSEVDVSEMRRQTSQSQELKPEDLKRLPSTTGNAVEEMLQLQAGVSTHSELSSQYNVRGGAFDENSVYINDVEVFRPFLVRNGQQEGLSVINPDMVERVTFSTGGFETKYGDKMSSTLDIKYKRLTPQAGKKTYWEATANASLLGAGAYVGFANRKLSWLNSVRYKTNQYMLGSMETTGEYRPRFLDFQTYLSYEPIKRWRIDIIGNVSDNHYDFTPQDRETKFGTMENVKSFRVYFDGKEKDLFRTYFGNISISHELTKNTRIALLASAFYTQEREAYDIQGQYWLDDTESAENLGVGTYFEHTRNFLKANVKSLKLMMQNKTRKHQSEIGLTIKRERIRENSVEYEMRDSAGYSIPHTGYDLNMIYSLRARNELAANRSEFYAQDTYRFTLGGSDADTPDSLAWEPTLFTLNYGVRMSHWNFNRETILSPRVSLGIIPSFNQHLTFRLATGLYYQAPFFKELRDTASVNGVTYATLNRKVKSQRSIHFIAGMDYQFKSLGRPFRFTAEAYYKLLSRLTPYTVSNVKVTYYGDNEASGHALGLDLKLYGEFVPGYDSWITFSLMNTRMKVNGQSMPLPTDQRYAVNLFFTDYFPGTTRWRMSLKLAYADGLPFSAPHKELNRQPFRAPAYKRADIGMSYLAYRSKAPRTSFKLREVWVGADCLNLFDISNVNSYYWVTDVTNQQYAVPNYLTRRLVNFRVQVSF